MTAMRHRQRFCFCIFFTLCGVEILHFPALVHLLQEFPDFCAAGGRGKRHGYLHLFLFVRAIVAAVALEHGRQRRCHAGAFPDNESILLTAVTTDHFFILSFGARLGCEAVDIEQAEGVSNRLFNSSLPLPGIFWSAILLKCVFTVVGLAMDL